MSEPTDDWQADLVRGKQKVPPRICIYGNHGIGKSSLALQFPNPIFINTEEGLDALDSVSFPLAQTIEDVKQSIGRLAKGGHEFKTVVLDTADWLVEPLITKHVEANHTEKELSFGKGAVMVAEEFREILQGFDVLRKKRRMNVVLIAHAAIMRFENPQTEPYDQFRPKLPTRCSALLQEWVDVMAFAAFKVLIKKTDVGFDKTVARGITTGERLLHLVESPAFVAKCRYPGAPDEITMPKPGDGIGKIAEYIPIEGA